MKEAVTSYDDWDILSYPILEWLLDSWYNHQLEIFKQTKQLYVSKRCMKIWYCKKLETENYTKAEKDLLTKSSPESAPTEVMDSLLMERGMRPERGAVAASSTSLFFNFANISVV